MDASGTKHYLSDSEISNQSKQELLDQFPGKERVIGLSWRSGVLTHKRVQYYLSHKAIIDLIGQRHPKSYLLVFNTVLTMTRLETSVRSQTYSFQMKIFWMTYLPKCATSRPAIWLCHLVRSA